MDKIKVAFLIDSLMAGGAERNIVSTTAELAQMDGFEVWLIYDFPTETTSLHVISESVKLEYFKSGDYSSIVNLIKCKNISVAVDYATWDMERIALWEMLIAAKSVKLVLSERSAFFYPLFNGHKFGSRYCDFSLRKKIQQQVDCLTAQTKHTCSQLATINSKVWHIPNHVTYFTENISRHDNNHIVYVGGLKRQEKQMSLLFSVMQGVFEQFSETELHCYGLYDQDEYNRLIDELDLSKDRIKMFGVESRIGDVYPNYSLQILTSIVEGNPNVLIEGGMHGLARVSLHTPGLEEMIDHGIDGILVERDKPETMTAEVVSLLKNREKRKALGRKARENLLQQKNENRVMRWASLIRKLDAGKEIEPWGEADNIDIIKDDLFAFHYLADTCVALQNEPDDLKQNKWYRFGQLSRKRKLWTIAKVISKKMKIYPLLRPLGKAVKRIAEK